MKIGCGSRVLKKKRSKCKADYEVRRRQQTKDRRHRGSGGDTRTRGIAPRHHQRVR